MSEPKQETKRVTPRNLALALSVVLVIQVVGLGITYMNALPYTYIVQSNGGSANFLGTSPTASAGNAVILVALVFVATLALVWVLRRKMVRSFKTIVFASVAMAAFFLTLITADTFAYNYLPPQYELPVAFLAAGGIVAAVAYTVFVKNRPWLSTTVLAFVGAETGSFFAGTLTPLTAIILPVIFSVYDIYAVFRGPLKQLIGAAPALALTGMSVKLGEFTLGLGDVVFYTLLPSLALLLASPLATVATVIAIDAGVAVTLWLLSKRRLLPGLPIPMLLGVAAVLYFAWFSIL